MVSPTNPREPSSLIAVVRDEEAVRCNDSGGVGLLVSPTLVSMLDKREWPKSYGVAGLGGHWTSRCH